MIQKIGIEFEWLAPKGLSRKTFAQYIQGICNGRIQSFWHAQVEGSLVPGKPIFHNLTQGFAVVDSSGKKLVHTVGDITIQADLDKKAFAKPSWYRIISDDPRIIHLIARHAPSHESDLKCILSPIAKIFGSEPIIIDNVIRIEDVNFASVALGTGLLGERERVCEVVTGILQQPTLDDIAFFTDPAQRLGFTIPKESATHIHFDALLLQNPILFRRLVYFLETYRWVLRGLLHTNPHCIRLGNWPEELFSALAHPSFGQLSWTQLQDMLKEAHLSKFCDFNIKNIVFAFPQKNTFEVRILPGVMQPEPVCNTIDLFQQIFLYLQHNEIQRRIPKEDTSKNRGKLRKLLNRRNWCFWGTNT